MTAAGLKQVDERKGGTSYQSAQDPRLHFGLGGRTRVDLVEVRWPSGAVTRLKDVAADQILVIREDTGIVPRVFPRLKQSQHGSTRSGVKMEIRGSRK